MLNLFITLYYHDIITSLVVSLLVLTQLTVFWEIASSEQTRTSPA